MSKLLKELSETRQKVYNLLMKHPNLKDCDNKLVSTFHLQEMGGIDVCKNTSAFDYMKLVIEHKLTSPSNISRARRKVQELYPETRGEKYEKRQKSEKEVRENINYL